MPYTNTFIQKMLDTQTLVLGTDKTYPALYHTLTDGCAHDATTFQYSLQMLEDASLGLRQAAAHGDAKNVLDTLVSLRLLCLSLDKHLKINPNHRAIVSSKQPLYTPNTTVNHFFLFKTSTNGRNALAWALHQSSNQETIKDPCEYAICITLLLINGFTLQNIPEKDRDTRNPLYSFITRFPELCDMHAMVDFSLAFQTLYPREKGMERMLNQITKQSLHFLSGYFFMQRYQESLSIWMKTLIDKKIQQVRVVEIGCGFTFHLPALLHFFNANNMTVNYVGYDINPSKINENIAIWRTLKARHSIAFECKDALTLINQPENHGKFDLVLIRHPSFATKEADKLVSECPRSLIHPEHGMLLLSAYFHDEAEHIHSLLNFDNINSKFTRHASPFVMCPGGLVMGKASNDEGTNPLPYHPDKFTVALHSHQLLCNTKPTFQASNSRK